MDETLNMLHNLQRELIQTAKELTERADMYGNGSFINSILSAQVLAYRDAAMKVNKQIDAYIWRFNQEMEGVFNLLGMKEEEILN